MKTHLSLGCGSDYKQPTDDIRWINVDMSLSADLQHDLRGVRDICEECRGERRIEI